VALPAADGARLDAVLFGEAQSRVVLSTRPGDADALADTLADHDAVQAHRLGPVTTGGVRLTVGGEPVLDATRDALATPYETAIPNAVA
jgi:phosphoribosylformylglycinamidine synthase